MVTEMIDIGKISSRGQVAIPSEIRNNLGLKEGSKVLFFVENDVLMMKKVNSKTFAQIAKPFHEAKKKINEDDVVDLIHRLRKK